MSLFDKILNVIEDAFYRDENKEKKIEAIAQKLKKVQGGNQAQKTE
jgi:hypothetical protein